MNHLLTFSPLLALLLAQASVAGPPCPLLEPGAPYPWQSEEIMPGDKWAELSIDINAKGRPVRCRLGRNNLESDMGFWICRSMMSDAKFPDVKKNGVLVDGTLKTRFRLNGRRHQRADDLARKRYFKDHPDERSRCYP